MRRRAWFLGVLITFFPVKGYAELYRLPITRNVALRALGPLRIVNARGAIQVNGWALDKIKVEGEILVEAPDQESADAFFQMTKLETTSLGEGGVEIAAFYDRGVSLREKQLRAFYEGQNVQMRIHVFAPYQLPLTVLGGSDAIQVEGWKEDLQVRSTSGPISVSKVSGDHLSLVSQSGDLTMSDWSAKQTSLTSISGRIEMKAGLSRTLFAETVRGEQVFGVDLSGDLLLASESAPIRLRGVHGNISFETGTGDVDLSDVVGAVSGKTSSGPIRVQLTQSNSEFESVIESVQGDIHLQVPETFESVVHASSKEKDVQLGFPLRPLGGEVFYGPQPFNVREGRIGNSKDRTLRVHSDEGRVVLSTK